jgi:hypothetical protein
MPSISIQNAEQVALAVAAGQQRFRLADLSDYADQGRDGLVPGQLPLISISSIGGRIVGHCFVSA